MSSPFKMEDKQPPNELKRVFVNDVDRYSSKHIAKFLSTCVTGDGSEEAEEPSPYPKGEPSFQVVGTVSSSSRHQRKGFLYEQYVAPSREELLEHLLECNVIVYNISDAATRQQIEEATWAVTALLNEMPNMMSRKIFILVSTIMTWAMTKPQNMDETDALITEEDFRRRRPHPNFRDHHNLEKMVLKLPKGKKSKLSGYVLASALQYGMGENLFHYFFKVAWLMQLPEVPLFGEGRNFLPMVHIHDVGGVIQNIIELRPKSKCILAVDESKNTLEDIVKMVSEALGTGKMIKVPEQVAIDTNAYKQDDLDILSINLRLDAFIIKDSFGLTWTSEGGMIDNKEKIISEYKKTRGLLPVKICLLGPPAVGKTSIAKKLCSRYQIHHIKVKEIIQEKIAELNVLLNRSDIDAMEESVTAVAQKHLNELNKSMETMDGLLANHQVYDILQERLNSRPCQNQGFLLDGYLKTCEQAKQIFSEDDMDMTLKKPYYREMITPEYVFALDAPDDFLIERVKGLPQSVAEEMRFTQDEFLPRLKRYRERNDVEETVLDYFDQLEIHPEHIDVSSYEDIDVLVKKIMETIGAPKNYGLLAGDQEQEDRKKEEEWNLTLAAEAAEKKRRNESALAEMAVQHEEWQENSSEVRRQENELLEARSLPLRNYLMQNVMPSLTEAMLECCKIKPDDPVDFLAEHLLRNDEKE